jgi:hypothetical protein
MVLKKRLRTLPDIEALKRLSQSLAMLDAIMSLDYESRCYSFNSKWGADKMMASMHKRSGDEYFILFNFYGAIIKGFTFESPMNPYATESGNPWPGVLNEVPEEFKDFLSEPAFTIEDATFCVWRRYIDTSWRVGSIDYPEGDNSDGSEALLHILDGQPPTYKEFAEEYYEREIELSAVEHVYRHRPLTSEIVAELNADVSLEKLKADIEEIGYPNGAI